MCFMAILSMIAISYLSDQYGCISFCISAFVNGQPGSINYDRMPRYSLSVFTILSSSSLALIEMHMPGISSFLFVSYHVLIAYLQSKFVAHAFTGYFCCIDGFVIVFSVVCVIGLQHLS